MRGSFIFQSLFELDSDPQPKANQRGRDADLIARRNSLIMHRYWFYGHYAQIRYSAVIKALSDEFFLTERRLQDIIYDCADTLKEMRANPPKLEDMRAKWPHMNWKS